MWHAVQAVKSNEVKTPLDAFTDMAQEALAPVMRHHVPVGAMVLPEDHEAMPASWRTALCERWAAIS